LASEPVIPAGSGAAGSGANGFFSSWLVGFVSAGFADCGDGDVDVDGDADGVCAWLLVAKHKQNKREVTNKRKAMVCTRFIVSPLAVPLIVLKIVLNKSPVLAAERRNVYRTFTE
jgi:hypothetical protein